MTEAMVKALAIAKRDGMVVAGAGSHAGRVERVNARTIDALVRRGLLVRRFGPDGGMAGVLPAEVAQ